MAWHHSFLRLLQSYLWCNPWNIKIKMQKIHCWETMLKGRNQCVWLMELLRGLLNNRLNLGLIQYSCSEHLFLARDPKHYLSFAVWSECGVLEDWAENSMSSNRNTNGWYVELDPAWSVMAKQPRLFTSRHIIPAANWKHAHISACLFTQGGKEVQESQSSGFPQSLSCRPYIFICNNDIYIPSTVNKAHCIRSWLYAEGWCKKWKG